MQLRMLTLPVTDGWAVAEIRWIPVRGHTFPVFYFFIEESEIGSGVLLNRDCRRRVELNRADFTSESMAHGASIVQPELLSNFMDLKVNMYLAGLEGSTRSPKLRRGRVQECHVP
jgi:hypothetical protein